MHDVKYAGKPSTVLKIGGVKVAVLPLIWKVLNAMGPDTLIPGGIVGGHKYIITGHSLGGGLASLFAFYMKLKHVRENIYILSQNPFNTEYQFWICFRRGDFFLCIIYIF